MIFHCVLVKVNRYSTLPFSMQVCPLLDFNLKRLIQKSFLFRWPGRTKMKHIYQRIFKEVNGDHKYLMCSYFQDKNFEVICAAIALDKIYLEYEDTVIYKFHQKWCIFYYFLKHTSFFWFMVRWLCLYYKWMIKILGVYILPLGSKWREEQIK